MNKHILKLSVVASAIAFASCGGGKKEEGTTASAVKNTGIDIANIDSTVKPTDDFYQFVNGKWLKACVIPESESRWGSFNELEKKNKEKLLSILDSAAADKNA
ncbi:MAG: M13 family peptidase, partial [Bacteroidia bacterium]